VIDAKSGDDPTSRSCRDHSREERRVLMSHHLLSQMIRSYGSAMQGFMERT
jgi:polyhydroxyalkanoate synthesis regulator protein